MFCRNCGRQIPDDAVFCDYCGTRTNSESFSGSNNELHSLSCPACGHPISFNDIKCPGCGREFREKKSPTSIKDFYESVLNENDNARKINIIKMFPIPNSREDILEFMVLASSNFNAAYYLRYKNRETVASAWLTKIKQCHSKGMLLLTNPSDRAILDKSYNDVYAKMKRLKIKWRIYIIVGIVLVFMGFACMLSVFKWHSFASVMTDIFLFITLTIAGSIFITKGRRKRR